MKYSNHSSRLNRLEKNVSLNDSQLLFFSQNKNESFQNALIRFNRMNGFHLTIEDVLTNWKSFEGSNTTYYAHQNWDFEAALIDYRIRQRELKQ